MGCIYVYKVLTATETDIGVGQEIEKSNIIKKYPGLRAPLIYDLINDTNTYKFEIKNNVRSQNGLKWYEMNMLLL